MTQIPHEVTIDGERYVRALDIGSDVEDVFQALMDQFWGGGQAWDGEYGSHVRIVVSDDPELRGWTWDELAEATALVRNRDRK